MPVPRSPRSAVLAAILLVAVTIAGLPARAQDGSEIRIVRDTYGVPHIYGETAEDVSYGAGYALATDRLWQMHLFRRIGKGELSDILGPLVIGIDKEIRFFTYTEAERATRLATYPQEIQDGLQAFADGINARLAEIRANPTLLPFEFVEWGVPLAAIEDWEVTDSVSLGDVLILSFGSGGGNELTYAGLLADLVERHGPQQGRAMFDDLILTTDPDAIPTVPEDHDYPNEDDFVRDAEADARRALTEDARISLSDTGTAASAVATPDAAKGTLEQLSLIPDVDEALEGFELVSGLRETLERVFTFGSNAQIVGPRLSETDNALQTGGPQVGYLLPQWLADFGLHSADGRLDATGMTFAGAGPAVLIGRGTGYAWTTTTGASDLTDTYVETLNPENPREYQFGVDEDGDPVYEPMECRTETHAFRGIPFDSQEICRTRHGPVFAFDEDNGVAYSLRYAWFNREGQTVEGFFAYNHVTSLEDFATFANYLSSNHNMFYVDDQGNYGFWHPGNHPVRADGVDLRLPQDGRGGSEWQGIRPIQDAPHAVNFDRGWLSNWNNLPARDWARERAYGALDNVDDLERGLDPTLTAVPDPEGGLVNPGRPCPQDHAAVDCRRLGFEDLSANLRYAAFKHHRDTHFRPFLPSDADLTSDLAVAAAAELRGWDGFLNDPDSDGLYEAGKAIVDRWVGVMREKAFRDDLGDLRFTNESLLWHVLSGDADELDLNVDWLNGESAEAFVARSFEQAAAELAEEFESEDPSTWQEEVDLEHYQRLNADLFADAAFGVAGLDNSSDTGLPGDVADHIEMDRGTYNHVVAYETPPSGSGSLGDAVSKAGSVIPPGQSGHISLTGQEAPHYDDQLELYLEWRYKPMPMTVSEARTVGESEIVLLR